MLQKYSTSFIGANTLYLKLFFNILHISMFNFIFFLRNNCYLHFFLYTFFTNKHSTYCLDYFDKYNSLFCNTVYVHNVLKKSLSYTYYIISQLIFYWCKITFRGKGFRVRKFKVSKKLTFNFGHSHWTRLRLNTIFFFCIKIRRQNYLLFSMFFYLFCLLKKQIKYTKFINRYTKRGLRLKKQFIKKRFGKISQVVSSLHF